MGEGDRRTAVEGARPDVLAHARLWLGTPYRHQASTLGAGCDCLGLVRGVWRAVRGGEPEAPPPYRPDWAETGGRELLLEAFARWLIPVDVPEPGDVLVFRMAPGAVAKHCAIQSGPDRMIHAYWGRACVESALGRWWRERLAAAFRFPVREGAQPWPK
ncbi:NlpC/P60 family protein [Caulobacter sp.]|nr:NlpC/P60 family protein [Caulobacter sp.]